MLGMGPEAAGDEIDPDLINAGKIPVTELAGASYFHHADSFAMMRGGHLDVCVLGAFQVSGSGDLANWHTGEPDAIPAVGGAMDLAIGAKDVFVMMTLFTKDGSRQAGAVVHLPADRRGLRQPGLHRPRRLPGRPRRRPGARAVRHHRRGAGEHGSTCRCSTPTALRSADRRGSSSRETPATTCSRWPAGWRC